jgi:hypothetical protein
MLSIATTAETESPTSVGMKRLAQYGLFAVFVAVAATALIRVVALAFVDIPVDFVPLPLGWGPVIAISALGAIGATVVYGVITRVSQRPNRTFTIVATIVLVLSFIPMLTLPPELAAAIAPVLPALAVMHVTVAAGSVGVLTRVSNAGASAEGQ